MILEDGTGPAGANSYVSEAYLGTYSDDRSITLASGDAEAALVRASAAVDAIYRGRFPGYRTHGRLQGLEWPRTAAFDHEWNPISGNEIPVELKNGVCEIAIRELESPGSFMPDLDRGGQIRVLRAGSVEIEYGSNADARTTFQLVDGILAPILSAAVASFSGYATRG